MSSLRRSSNLVVAVRRQHVVAVGVMARADGDARHRGRARAGHQRERGDHLSEPRLVAQHPPQTRPSFLRFSSEVALERAATWCGKSSHLSPGTQRQAVASSRPRWHDAARARTPRAARARSTGGGISSVSEHAAPLVAEPPESSQSHRSTQSSSLASSSCSQTCPAPPGWNSHDRASSVSVAHSQRLPNAPAGRAAAGSALCASPSRYQLFASPQLSQWLRG